MTDLTYNISRVDAAKYIGVSTRTIDRYVKRGNLSYKKIGNKIMLSEAEVFELKKNFESPQRSYSQIVVSNTSSQNNTETSQDLNSLVDLLKQKDKQIEDKNALIFNMQHNIGVLESKLKNTIALPDHTKEKEELQKEKQEIFFEKKQLIQELEKEKIKNIIYVAIVILLFFLFVLFVGFS